MTYEYDSDSDSNLDDEDRGDSTEDMDILSALECPHGLTIVVGEVSEVRVGGHVTFVSYIKG
jgi:hypothetical protein